MTEDELAGIEAELREDQRSASKLWMIEDAKRALLLVAEVRRLQRENAELRAQLDDNFGGEVMTDRNQATSMNGEEPFAGMQLVNGQWIHDETLGGKTDEEIVFETNADGSWKAMTPDKWDALTRLGIAHQNSMVGWPSPLLPDLALSDTTSELARHERTASYGKPRR